MLDIKLIRENPENIKTNLKKRIDFDTTIVDKVLKLDTTWREEKKQLDTLKSQKNKESKNIAQVKKDGGNIKEQIAKVKTISDSITEQDKNLKEIENKRNELLNSIPNLLDKEVPMGADDEENTLIKTVGKKPEFKFKIKTHQELCELNDWYDLERAARNSGARFYYIKKELVLLEIALYQFVLNKLTDKGFTLMEVPPMLKASVARKAIPLTDFEESIYTVPHGDGEDMFLIATSEHALSTYHMNETFQKKDLPIKYAGISQCYRREAGVTKDEKGIFRVHNFNKIEQFVYCAEEDSEKIHKEITDNIEEIFSELEIHYQMVEICSGDIGIFAARKYDLEAWLPGQDKFREMGSSSNYRDYGARTLNVRYQDEKNEMKFCSTLNNTAIALTRAMIAIIENHQTEDGNVHIPKALRPYLGNRECLINKS